MAPNVFFEGPVHVRHQVFGQAKEQSVPLGGAGILGDGPRAARLRLGEPGTQSLTVADLENDLKGGVVALRLVDGEQPADAARFLQAGLDDVRALDDQLGASAASLSGKYAFVL